MKNQLAHTIATITEEDVKKSLQCRINEKYDDSCMNVLLNQVRMISAKSSFCQSYKTVNRFQLKSTIIQKGSPTWYVTISPSDSHNPLNFIVCNEGSITIFSCFP